MIDPDNVCMTDIIPKGSTHRLVVHRRSLLVLSPQPRHGLGVDQLEDAGVSVRPADVARTVVGAMQQLQQELPQVRRPGARPSTAPRRRRAVTGRGGSLAGARRRRGGRDRDVAEIRLRLQSTN